MPGLLYYPEIMPPTEVAYRAALYWDFVATIVPEIYEDKATEAVRRLRDEGLYFPVHIEGPEYDAVLPHRFFAELAHLMDTIPLDELIPELARASRDPANQFPVREQEVYRDKLSLTIMRDLEDMGLAYRAPGRQTVWLSTPIAELLFAIAIERVTEIARAEFPSSLFTCTVMSAVIGPGTGRSQCAGCQGGSPGRLFRAGRWTSGGCSHSPRQIPRSKR